MDPQQENAPEYAPDARDDAVQCFDRHVHVENHELTGVFALAMTPNPAHGMLSVSGGIDEQAYLFDAASGAVVATLTGATDTCAAVGFAQGGTFVVVASMDGIARVYRVPTALHVDADGALVALPEPLVLEPHCLLEGAGGSLELLACHSAAPACAAMGEDGTLYAWQWHETRPGQSRLVTVVAAHAEPATQLALVANGSRAVSSAADAVVALTDLNSATVLSRVNIPTGVATSLAPITDELVAVGTEAGDVYLVNFRNHSAQAFAEFLTDSVETVLSVPVSSQTPLACVLAADVAGGLALYDLASGQLRWGVQTSEAPEGTAASYISAFTRGCRIPGTPFCAVGSVDGYVALVDVRTGIHRVLAGSEGPITVVATPSSTTAYPYIAAASEDGSVRVFALIDE